MDKEISISNEANLPTKYGKFKIKAYKDGCQEHLAIMSLDFFELESPLVRIHSECLTGDTLGSLKCDCSNQLHLSLELIAKHGGLVIYHRQEGRNIGLLNKINAYSLQDKGFDTIEANLELGFKEDEREYSAVESILKDLNVKKARIITNNPHKIDFLEHSGVEIIERIPAITPVNCHNTEYLNTKKNQMGHFL
ncbi:MAG: GTP cyclohydrolase II [Sulfurimonas sp.]